MNSSRVPVEQLGFKMPVHKQEGKFIVNVTGVLVA